MLADPALRDGALQVGRIVWRHFCDACHGSGGDALRTGCPDLTDDEWLWGGSADAVEHTIAWGVRSVHPEDFSRTRTSSMPAFAGILRADELDRLAGYVQAAMATRATDPASDSLYRRACAACHGAHGEGSQAIGAPRLNDDRWQRLHPDRAIIRRFIAEGTEGASMPAWRRDLTTGEIRAVAAWVRELDR